MATKTIYSNRGTAREIPEERYDEFKASGWHDTNPLDTPEETPVETPETPKPSPVETPETPIIPEAITPEQLAPVELPEVGKPYQPIQDVFGADWKPAPVFEQLGLTEQGIYGAVRVAGTDAVYTIGEGGRKETAESYLERFGTDEQTGIVGEISVEEAKKLGINIEADTLLSDVSEEIPESFTAEMTPEQKAQVGTDILAAAEIKYGIEGLKEEKDTATTNLINTISGMWDKFTEAKEEKEEDLKMEEKNKAISDAQTAYTKVKSVYDKYINELTHSTMTTAHIGGLQAKARSQMAVELAPLSAAIQIAQGNWDRAKEILDDFSDDWKTAQEWNIQAAEIKINMLGENLTDAQEDAKFEAQNKLDWFREDYQRKLDTIEEVKKLSLMYSQAGILISDSWEDAYRKIQPFDKSEEEFEQKMRDLELKTAQKKLDEPIGSGTLTGRQLAQAEKIRIELQKSVGEDGYVNTEVYSRLKSENPAIFKKGWFPPEESLNPKDPTANKYFQTSTQAIKDEELSDEEFYQQTKDIFIEYKDKGRNKEEIKESFGKDFTMDHQIILDEVFGAEQTFWQWLIPGGK